jgi:hypothetical protein
LAKTRLWEGVFPAGIPGGVKASRWLAMFAAILGLARVAVGGMVTGLGFIGLSRNAYGFGMEMEGWFPALMILDQLWSVAFWFTLTILFFTAANQFLMRYTNQLKASTRK